MKDILERVRDLGDKWRDANRQVHDVCRDAAEEIRVLRAELNALKSKKSTDYANHFTLGWGKGKDE
jgi:hypothetical protein